jgi:hypothetical protein
VLRNTGASAVSDYRIRFRVAEYSPWSEWQGVPKMEPGQASADCFFPLLDIEKLARMTGARRAVVGFHIKAASALIKFILLLPVIPVVEIGLFLFFEEEVAHDQVVHFGAHETAVGILRRADDRLSPYVETGVDDDAIAGPLTEGIDQLPVPRVYLLVDGLDSGGVVNMGYGRHI